MEVHLSQSNLVNGTEFVLTGSKSESNRLLILQSLIPGIKLYNLSNADDVRLMKKALESDSDIVDIHHAGTAMRFLTAYFAATAGREIVLTGSNRMKQRPIGILVDALRKLGADIKYMEAEEYPPLKIKGRELQLNWVELESGVSSQYITALMLIGSMIKGGLTIQLRGKPTSVPYIKMTQKLLSRVGIKCSFEDGRIMVEEYGKMNNAVDVTVESDWSSASYFYSLAALSSIGTRIKLRSYRDNSYQGDSALVSIYRNFGVLSRFDGDVLILEKTADPENRLVSFDLVDTPDLAQTIAVSCLGLGLDCDLSGLHTLKIKETDRLEALKQEIEKFGGRVEITDRTLKLHSPEQLKTKQLVKTYNDHRMAMAFAPLALVTELFIEDAGVVSKSYPDFWRDMGRIGLSVRER